MTTALLALSYEELKARRDVVAERLRSADPLRDVTYTHLVCSPDVPVLAELDEALEIVAEARRRLSG